MHPEIRWPKRDACPLCGMNLEAVNGSTQSKPPSSALAEQKTAPRKSTPQMPGHTSMPMANGRTQERPPMNNMQDMQKTMNHSMRSMGMSGLAMANHGSMRNGGMGSQSAMESIMNCPTCTSMMSNASMKRPSYAPSNHAGTSMNHRGMQGHGTMDHMMMGCGMCMEMMQNMGGMSHSMGSMGEPMTSYRQPEAPMPPMRSRCGC
jgi:hypothetical protein